MAYKYAFNEYNKETMVRASRTNVPISLKKSVELANYLRGRKVKTVLKILDEVEELKRPIPYKRYFQEMAHKKGKGIATGGYPVNVAKEFKKLFKIAIAAAKEKELGDDSNLVVLGISVRKGERMWRFGRHLGRMAKRTHVEVVLGVGGTKND